MISKETLLKKVGTDDNLADALTEGVDANAITRHAGVGDDVIPS